MRVQIEQARDGIETDVNAEQQKLESASLPKVAQHDVEVVVEPSIIFLNLICFRFPSRPADCPKAPIGLVLDVCESGELLGKPFDLCLGFDGQQSMVPQRSAELDDLPLAITFKDQILLVVASVGLRSRALKTPGDFARERIFGFLARRSGHDPDDRGHARKSPTTAILEFYFSGYNLWLNKTGLCESGLPFNVAQCSHNRPNRPFHRSCPGYNV